MQTYLFPRVAIQLNHSDKHYKPVDIGVRSMKILNRIVRICQADIHALMDRFEDKELLLKQYLRDMSTALLQKEDRHKILIQTQKVAAQRLANTNQEIDKLERDLDAVLKQNKDNIARNLIRRLRSITELQSQMQHHIDNLDHEMAQLQAVIDQQRLQLKHLKLRAANYIDCSGQTNLNSSCGANPDRNLVKYHSGL